MSSNAIIPPPVLHRNSSDDEILGLMTPLPRKTARRDARNSAAQDSAPLESEQLSMDFNEGELPQAKARSAATNAGDAGANRIAEHEPEHLRAALDANPELRDAWREAGEYRETFATPEAARAATALLQDLNRMDALFFSRRPEDHAELARAVSQLDPEAFASLARAMNGLTTRRGMRQTLEPSGKDLLTGRIRRNGRCQTKTKTKLEIKTASETLALRRLRRSWISSTRRMPRRFPAL